MKKTRVDVHTHTLVSGHAFSTLAEMVAEGQRKGLEIMGITEHGPSIPGTCDPLYFWNLHVVPRRWGSLRLLLGAELNILDTRGTLDLSEKYYERMDLRIAGIHSHCWKGGTRDENTAGVLAAIRNPWVNIISHPGDGAADLAFEPLVLAAKENHTLLEINNASLKPARHKPWARDNNLEILRLSKKYGVPVILGSDAHITFDVANYEHLYPLLNETDFPDELILNYDSSAFCQYIGIPAETLTTG